ncbi:MAG: deoxynucleoside kinase [Alphaproteobacteria bacterium]|nr:deoxynucleoside kinase [Alphaproteobacteria bacterium]
MIAAPLIVAFEGVAGVGKTTLACAVQQELGCALVAEFPGNFLDGFLTRLSACGSSINLHENCETPLAQTFLLAANAAFKAETAHLSEPLAHEIILFDRSIYSVIAYQEVVFRQAGNVNPKVPMEFFKDSILEPDLIFFIDCSTSVIEPRLKNRGIQVSKQYLEFLDEVRCKYEGLFASKEHVIFVNTEVSIDTSKKFIIDELLRRVEAMKRPDVHKSFKSKGLLL